jgi:chromosome partitioning protein
MNQQQEIGKTTTVMNLAHALALAGKQVAIIEMDPKGNLSTMLGLAESPLGIDHVLLNDMPLNDVMVSARNNVMLIPAGHELMSYETVEKGGSARAYKLKRAIEASVLQGYDYVLIDSPSKFGLLSLNCVFASSDIVMPVTSHYESLNGISQLIDVVKRTELITGFSLKLWLLSTRMNMKRRLAVELRHRICKYFPKRVLSTIINEHTGLAENNVMGKTVFEDPTNTISSADYASLAIDVMEGRVV